jgi:hypothetical protein
MAQNCSRIDELERIWKGAVTAQSGYYSVTCLEEMSNPTEVRIAIVPTKIQTKHIYCITTTTIRLVVYGVKIQKN